MVSESSRRKSAPYKSARRKSAGRWSARVTRESDALDLEGGVFRLNDPRKIAASLKRSAEHSKRRKSAPYRSALSMLVFYITGPARTCRPDDARHWNRPKASFGSCLDERRPCYLLEPPPSFPLPLSLAAPPCSEPPRPTPLLSEPTLSLSFSEAPFSLKSLGRLRTILGCRDRSTVAFWVTRITSTAAMGRRQTGRRSRRMPT